MNTIYHCFPGGTFKVLTMSYDDGTIADRRLVSIFNKYGIKGTFHINGGLLGTKAARERIPASEMRELYNGHEISCHTFTHPTIARCPLPMVAQQVIEDRKVLEEIAGYPVRGLSYPNGSYNQEIVDMLPALGIEYSRVVGNTDGFAIPEDFLRWTSTCHHNHNLMKLGEQFAALDKKQYLYMMYVWGHSYEFDNDNNWDLMENFCKMMSGRSDTWYATNIEIVDYMNALKALRFTADGSIVHNPSASPVWLSINNDAIVKVEGGETKKLY